MKHTRKILLGSLVLAGLQFGLSSCLTHAYVGTGIYYGPHRDPWFRDDPWLDGHHYFGASHADASVGIYIHPPRRRQ